MTDRTDEQPTATETVEEIGTNVKEPNKRLKSEQREFKVVYAIRLLCWNIALLIDGLYSIVKKTFKFWWVVIIALLIFYPKPITDLIETIKNIFL